MKPVVLAIMDGVGISEASHGNAYKMASKPILDKLFSEFPYTELKTSGNAVGLPSGQMGNSEVGHLNIGAGRVVYQQLELVNKSINDGEYKNRKTLTDAVAYAKANNSKVHVMGLLSDGGVHSHIDHFIATINVFNDNNIKVISHAFLDGRDVGPTTAKNYLAKLDNYTDEIKNGYIKTVSGRYYAMDRDKRFERIQLTYDAMTLGKGATFKSACEGVEKSYESGVNDEFVVPFVVGETPELVDENDVIVFINFRPDRAIQISRAFTEKNFDGFEREKVVSSLFYASMSAYSGVESNVIFDNEKVKNGLGEYLSNKGYKQLRIAETEKYAHVTFFFDGGEEKDYKGMKKVLIPSPKEVATYDLKPEMSAKEVTESLISELSNGYDVVILNFANPDMVGHTGNVDATIKAVETVDRCIGEVYKKVDELGGVMLITADHGNSEILLDSDNNVITSHSTNNVPFCITKRNVMLKNGMSLCDIAPTILHLIGEEKPAEMTGKTIIMEEENE